MSSAVGSAVESGSFCWGALGRGLRGVGEGMRTGSGRLAEGEPGFQRNGEPEAVCDAFQDQGDVERSEADRCVSDGLGRGVAFQLVGEFPAEGDE